MKKATDALAAVAATLDIDFIRSLSLTEADFDNHNRKSDKALMVYNGASNIDRVLGAGVQTVDTVTCEIYFLTKATTKDMKALDVDELLAITQRLVDKTYAELNAQLAQDIEAYTMEGVSVLTDMFVGYRVEMGLSFYNDGC